MKNASKAFINLS